MAEKWADRADLHTHTTASDGTLSPRQLVALAGELGLGAVAITDHDTVAGLAEGLAAGEALGVRVVPGVELSTSQAGCEVHIVGLFIRPDSPALLDFLTRQREERVRRNQRMLERLAQAGMPVAPRPAGRSSTRRGAWPTWPTWTALGEGTGSAAFWLPARCWRRRGWTAWRPGTPPTTGSGRPWRTAWRRNGGCCAAAAATSTGTGNPTAWGRAWGSSLCRLPGPKNRGIKGST